MYTADETFLAEDRFDRPAGDNVRPIADVLVELLARYRSQYPDLEVTVFETPGVAT